MAKKRIKKPVRRKKKSDYPGEMSFRKALGMNPVAMQVGGSPDDVDYDSPEYRKAYTEGKLVSRLNSDPEDFVRAGTLPAYNFDALQETGRDIKEVYPNFNSLTEEEKRYFRDTSPIGRSIRRKAEKGNKSFTDEVNEFATGMLYQTPMAALQIPQSALIEGVQALRGKDANWQSVYDPYKQRVPSDVWGFETTDDMSWYNPRVIGNFAMDMIADPTNLVGAGFLKSPIKAAIRTTLDPTGLFELTGKGFNQGKKFLVRNTPLRNAYKLNPWAFKPNPETYYRGIGKSGLDDALNSGVLRTGNKTGNYGEDLYMTPDFKIAKGNYSKDQPVYKGDPFGGVDDDFVKILPKDSRSYIAEIPKSSLKNPERIGTNVVINKGSIPLDNIKLYKEDWLRGYKPIEVPRQLPGSPNATPVVSISENQNFLTNLFKPKSKNINSNFNFDKIPERKFTTLDDVKTNYRSEYNVENPSRTFYGEKLNIEGEESNFLTRSIDDKIEKHYNNEITFQKFKDYGGDEISYQKLIDNINTPSKTVSSGVDLGLLTDEGVSLAVHNKYLDPATTRSTLFHEKAHQSKVVASKREDSLLPELWDDINELTGYTKNYTDANKGSIGMYLSSPTEVYSRIMELKYKAGLKPYENFTKELLEKTGEVIRDSNGRIIRMSGIMPPNYSKNTDKWLKLINKAPVIVPPAAIIGAGAYGANQMQNAQPTMRRFGGNLKFQKGGDYNMQRALELGYTPDEAGHYPSVDSETGMWLKSKQHPTAWMEYMQGYALNPENNRRFDVVPNVEGYFGENQLQYVDKKQIGGRIKFQRGGSLTTPTSASFLNRDRMNRGVVEGPSVFEDVMAGLYGAGEGVLDAATMGATDEFTDMGFKALQGAAGTTGEAAQQQQGYAGVGNAVGAIGGAALGIASPEQAVTQSVKGAGKAVSGFSGSPEGDAAGQAIQQIPGLMGNFKDMKTFMASRGGRFRYQQGGQMLNQNLGLTEIGGPSHAEGGVTLPNNGQGPDVEVEGPETIYTPENYVMSEKIKASKTALREAGISEKYAGKSYADISKAIKKQGGDKLRPNDRLTLNFIDSEMKKLIKAHDIDRQLQEQKNVVAASPEEQQAGYNMYPDANSIAFPGSGPTQVVPTNNNDPIMVTGADGSQQMLVDQPIQTQAPFVEEKMARGGQMIKRADGSYSRRGLWDNIRANRGSGKKPTKQMLEQERKIKAAEKAYGGYYAEGGSFDNPGFRALPGYVQAKIKSNSAYGGQMFQDGGMVSKDKALKEYNDFKAYVEKARQAIGTNDTKTLKELGLRGMYDENDLARDFGELQRLRKQAGLGVIEEAKILFPHVGQQMRGTVNQWLGTNFEVGGYMGDYIGDDDTMEYGSGGYTVRRSNDRKGKTHVVTGPDGTKKYFGDPKLGERGKSKYGKKAFYARHKKNLAKNPYFRAYARATWEDGGYMDMLNANVDILDMDTSMYAYGGPMMYAQGGIHIDPSKRGTFKAQASKMGMGVQEAASTILNAPEGKYSPAMRKKANFARNFAKEDGGYYQMGGDMMQPQQMPQQGGGQEEAAQQIIQQVAQMLQQNVAPEQVVGKLIEMGVPQQQAVQIVEMVAQQMQGQQQPAMQQQMPQPPGMMRYGGKIRKEIGGKYFNQGDSQIEDPKDYKSPMGTYAAGAAGSMVGPLSNIAAAAFAPDPTYTAAPKFQKYDYTPVALQQAAGNQALANTREGFRRGAPTQGSYLSNMAVASPSMAMNLGEALAKTRYGIDTSNIGIANQEAQLAAAQAEKNALLKDQSIANRWQLGMKGAEGIGSNVQGFSKDMGAKRMQDMIVNSMKTGDFSIIGYDMVNGQLIPKLAPTGVTTYNDGTYTAPNGKRYKWNPKTENFQEWNPETEDFEPIN